MANALRLLDICNQALRVLGESAVTSLASTTSPKVLTFNQHYATKRDELLNEHFWNFATIRAVLYAYSEPAGTLTPGAATGDGVTFTTSITGVFGLEAVGQRLVHTADDGEATIAGLVTSSPAATLTPASGALTPETTGVIFTASAAVFGASDVGKLIENQTTGGTGVARITAFTDTQHVVATIVSAFDSVTAIASGAWRLVRTDQVTADITEDFPSAAAIAAEDWRLYTEAPDWGFTYRIALPTDYIRIQRVRDSDVYQREGEYLVSDEESLSVTYTQRVTDVTKFPPHFVTALVYAMAALMAEPVTGQRAKSADWAAIADAKLRRAKAVDGQEGSAPMLRALDLVVARRGGRLPDRTEE